MQAAVIQGAVLQRWTAVSWRVYDLRKQGTVYFLGFATQKSGSFDRVIFLKNKFDFDLLVPSIPMQSGKVPVFVRVEQKLCARARRRVSVKKFGPALFEGIDTFLYDLTRKSKIERENRRKSKGVNMEWDVRVLYIFLWQMMLSFSWITGASPSSFQDDCSKPLVGFKTSPDRCQVENQGKDAVVLARVALGLSAAIPDTALKVAHVMNFFRAPSSVLLSENGKCVLYHPIWKCANNAIRESLIAPSFQMVPTPKSHGILRSSSGSNASDISTSSGYEQQRREYPVPLRSWATYDWQGKPQRHLHHRRVVGSHLSARAWANATAPSADSCRRGRFTFTFVRDPLEHFLSGKITIKLGTVLQCQVLTTCGYVPRLR